MPVSFEIPNVGASVFPLAGAMLPHRFGQGRAVLPESRNMAPGQLGFPRNLGTPVVSMRKSASRVAEPKEPRPPVLRLGPSGANYETHRVVLPGEGNRARREGRQES